MNIKLNEDQEELRKTIQKHLDLVKSGEGKSSEDIQESFRQMKVAAHELHMQLEPKPKHHNYMIKNRGLNPEDPEFYDHIHPVEDLLKYLENPSANDDPVDQTIGKKFELQIYSNRWGHKDRYELTRTSSGWHVSHLSYNGEDDINGEMNVFYESMKHDGISFPVNVDSYMRSIWLVAQMEGLSYEDVQKKLNEIADWISQTELNAPKDLLI